MDEGFLRGDATQLHKPLDEGVVRGDLAHLTIANPIDAGVADVCGDDLIAVD